MAEKPGLPVSGPAAEHRATLAWQRLGLECRDPKAVEVLREKRKSAAYRLIGVGHGGGDVIAKRGTNKIIGIERTVYEQVLERVAVDKLRYYGSVTEGPDVAWIFLEQGAGVRWDESVPEDCAHAGRWIAQLHVAAAEAICTVPLPDLGPRTQLQRLRDIRSTIANSVENVGWSSPHRMVLDGLLAVFDRFEACQARIEEICAGAPVTLVHGDLRPKNTRVSEDKSDPYFRAFDWETAGIAAPAVDLARVDARAYASVVGAAWPHVDLAAVEQLAVVGHLLRNLDAVRWDGTGSLGTPSHQDYRIGRLRLYTERIDAGLRELSRGKAGASHRGLGRSA
ncbi:MAG TPA: phosphotransferase [Planctomycetota bacterium]|nr:phosphotransferase [Planctomycetota bacterium]